jgi:hypothetical protein
MSMQSVPMGAPTPVSPGDDVGYSSALAGLAMLTSAVDGVFTWYKDSGFGLVESV